jgi:hypothetical protein
MGRDRNKCIKQSQGTCFYSGVTKATKRIERDPKNGKEVGETSMEEKANAGCKLLAGSSMEEKTIFHGVQRGNYWINVIQTLVKWTPGW